MRINLLVAHYKLNRPRRVALVLCNDFTSNGMYLKHITCISIVTKKG
jgi:hypothetical protein